MKDKFTELLESPVFNDETRATLSEAWNKKLNEAKAEMKKEVEAEIREEFKDRYDNDKARLYEATELMMKDAISNYSESMISESVKLKEEREELAKAVKDVRKKEKEKISEQMKVFEAFIVEELKDKVLSLTEEKKKLEKKIVDTAKKEAKVKEAKKQKVKETIENLNNFVLTKLSEELKALKAKELVLENTKKKIGEELRNYKASVNEATVERVAKLEKFIIEQLKEEITEYKEEKDSLAKLRVKMVKESKDHLNTVRKEFVQRAAGLIEEKISSRMEKEISDLKESITEARNCELGLSIFNNFKDAFMNSHLAEGTEIRKIENKLLSVESQLTEARKEVEKQRKLNENASIRLKMTEERVLRNKTMEKLLRPLNKDKRDIMESLLETTKTGELEQSFNKYLSVLNEESTPRNKNTKILSEKTNRVKAPVEEFSGNRQKLKESVITDEDKEAEDRAEIRRLAGIKN